ncbi:uncharacterized protein LOC130924284 [Corythoichthys intestinalis]|uniref:uncharacterized protein LOC130924284 n=1 Tax=Corythoichthys intestinalis TaxID=161448 RepID=UPI0025A57680|nr:uncharacterized protein LOC130924284 [Corythoichthys intestinalis]
MEDLIKPEAIVEAVKARVSQISATQRALLVAGTPDSETKAILVDTITEVIQKITSDVVKHLQPVFIEHLRGHASQAQVNMAIDRCSPRLSECITETFSAALDSPPQKCEGVMELTSLMESEVKHRVNSALSVAKSTTEWPSEPTLLIRGTMSSVANLASIFRKALEYFRHVFSRARTPRQLLCGSSDMKVNEMTDSVRRILLKWSSPKESRGSEVIDPVTLEDAQLAAVDITKTITQDSYGGSGDAGVRGEARITRFNLNWKLILKKVKNFFKSVDRQSGVGSKRTRRSRFFSFARMQFARMLGSLKSAFKNRDACLVSLTPDRRSRTEDGGSPSGATSEGTKVPDSRPAYRTSTLCVRQSQHPTFDFENIQESVDKLYTEFNQMDIPDRAGKVKRYIDEKIGSFSEELTSQLYAYVMSCQSDVYEVPSGRPQTPLMDTVLWGRRGKIHWDGQIFSPEVLYAMTEDAVWRFLQQLFLWLDVEPANEETYADEVSGALTDINQLVEKAMSPQIGTSEELPVEEQVVPKLDLEQSSEASASTLRTTTPEIRSRTADNPTMTPDLRLGTTPELQSSRSADIRTRTTQELRTHTTDDEGTNTDEMLSELESENIPALQEKLTRLLVYTLITQLGKRLRSKRKRGVRIDALVLVIERLLYRALEEITPRNIRDIRNLSSMDQVVTPVVKDLMVEFGTPYRLAEAVMADNPVFDDAVFRHLKIHISAIKDPPRRGNIFSIINKTLAMLRFMGSSY